MKTDYTTGASVSVKSIKTEDGIAAVKTEVDQATQDEDVEMQDTGSLAQREAAFLLFSKFTKEVIDFVCVNS